MIKAIVWLLRSETVCAWCKTVMKHRRIKWLKPITSHGMCAHCSGQWKKE